MGCDGVKLYEEKFCVYTGAVDGKVVYVGMGSLERPEHLNSGVSHLYQANRHHFNGGSVDITILKTFPCKNSALEYEKGVIAESEPSWNTAGTTRSLLRNRIKKVTDSFKTKGIQQTFLIMAGEKNRK